ncbi:MAG: amidohydrolase family protein, partial [Microbacterium sp.]
MIGTIVGTRVAGAGRELLPDDGPVDVFLDGGVIADIAPTGAMASRGETLDADGAWLIPGLWDHHVHVVQWALVAQREALGHATSAAHAASIMGSAPVLADGRRVGTGFRDALWSDEPTLAVLDAATGDVPTYLINADVHSVWLNTAALRREAMPIDATGILREAPAFE